LSTVWKEEKEHEKSPADSSFSADPNAIDFGEG